MSRQYSVGFALASVGSKWSVRTAVNGLELAQPEFLFQNRPAEFTAKFPLGKIPTFEGADGLKQLKVSQSPTIVMCSIVSVNLLGSSAHEVAIVDQWVRFAEHEIAVPTGNITGMIYGYLWPFNLEILEKNTERILRSLTHLESHLATRPSSYVALDAPTLADFLLVGAIFAAAGAVLGTAERAKFPHVFAPDDKVKEYWGTEQFVDERITECRPVTFA